MDFERHVEFAAGLSFAQSAKDLLPCSLNRVYVCRVTEESSHSLCASTDQNKTETSMFIRHDQHTQGGALLGPSASELSSSSLWSSSSSSSRSQATGSFFDTLVLAEAGDGVEDVLAEDGLVLGVAVRLAGLDGVRVDTLGLLDTAACFSKAAFLSARASCSVASRRACAVATKADQKHVCAQVQSTLESCTKDDQPPEPFVGLPLRQHAVAAWKAVEPLGGGLPLLPSSVWATPSQASLP